MRYDTGLIELGDSELHGLGVFAKKDIKKGQVIEYCPVLRYKSMFPLPSILDAYCFDDAYGDEYTSGLQLGFGGLYNSSHTGDGMDAFPIYDDDKKMYHWIAVRDIPKDKEILTWYGNDFTIESIGEEQVLKEWDKVEKILETLGIKFKDDGSTRRTLDNN